MYALARPVTQRVWVHLGNHCLRTLEGVLGLKMQSPITDIREGRGLLLPVASPMLVVVQFDP